MSPRNIIPEEMHYLGLRPEFPVVEDSLQYPRSGDPGAPDQHRSWPPAQRGVHVIVRFVDIDEWDLATVSSPEVLQVRKQPYARIAHSDVHMPAPVNLRPGSVS